MKTLEDKIRNLERDKRTHVPPERFKDTFIELDDLIRELKENNYSDIKIKEILRWVK
jgi:hypothetical protein